MSDVKETVNHPSHYQHASGVECIDIIELMSCNLGNALSYVWRAPEKGSELEDLRKARWYIVREITRREKMGSLALIAPLFPYPKGGDDYVRRYIEHEPSSFRREMIVGLWTATSRLGLLPALVTLIEQEIERVKRASEDGGPVSVGDVTESSWAPDRARKIVGDLIAVGDRRVKLGQHVFPVALGSEHDAAGALGELLTPSVEIWRQLYVRR